MNFIPKMYDFHMGYSYSFYNPFTGSYHTCNNNMQEPIYRFQRDPAIMYYHDPRNPNRIHYVTDITKL